MMVMTVTKIAKTCRQSVTIYTALSGTLSLLISQSNGKIVTAQHTYQPFVPPQPNICYGGKQGSRR